MWFEQVAAAIIQQPNEDVCTWRHSVTKLFIIPCSVFNPAKHQNANGAFQLHFNPVADLQLAGVHHLT
jgi:hypothetical protein